jgi:anaerobic magnesium-protoporphyrin IX monomethyl ester cyclase
LKILLSNPPWYKENCFGVRAGSRWPHFREGPYLPFPFFLGYASALLEKKGKDILVIDALADRIKNEEFIERVKQYSPHLLLMEISTPSIYDDLNLAGEIKKLFPQIKIAFCGPHILMYNEQFLKENNVIDFILYSEYEYTLLELAEHMETDNKYDNIIGLIYRNDKGDCIKNLPRPLIADLNDIPWPARHLFPIMKYCDEGYGVPGPSLQMWASRGCPYGCIFCFWPQVMYGGRKYRTRNPEDVVEEIKFFTDKYDFKSYVFDDDTFNIGKERMLEFCKKIKEKGLNLPWAIMARADTMDFDILDEMKAAGLTGIKYGVESGDQEIVNSACKSLDLKKVMEIVKHTKKLGIHIHLTFTFGLPGETKETIKKTIDFALKADPDTLQFSIMTPFPGSDYYDLLDKKGYILTKDWAKYNGSCSAVMKTENLNPQDLVEAVTRADELWRSHVVRRDFKDKKLYYLKKGILNPYKALKTIKNLLIPDKDL